MMTVRPIIFSAPMVRALLAGSKTMTRRALKPQPVQNDAGLWTLDLGRRGFSQTDDVPATMRERGWLRFAPGDLLWVRETCAAVESHDGLDCIRYEADQVWTPIENTPEAACRWLAMNHYRKSRSATVPPIHMPRWASRLTLAVTAVKVERLQDITESEAIREGIHPLPQQAAADPSAWWESGPGEHQARTPTDSFQLLWRTINGPGAWEANPWVVALTFTVHRTNVHTFTTADCPLPTAGAA